ncbi:hypothetical protein YC2023_006251 [Brassica napus]
MEVRRLALATSKTSREDDTELSGRKRPILLADVAACGERQYLDSPRWSKLETEVSMDTARASPCGSLCNGLWFRMLQPICKFCNGQGSNPGVGTPAGAPMLLYQSNLVRYI